MRKGGKGLGQIMNENKRNDGKGEREKRSQKWKAEIRGHV